MSIITTIISTCHFYDYILLSFIIYIIKRIIILNCITIIHSIRITIIILTNYYYLLYIYIYISYIILYIIILKGTELGADGWPPLPREDPGLRGFDPRLLYNVVVCTYIYICIDRERERYMFIYRYIYIYIYIYLCRLTANAVSLPRPSTKPLL